MRVEALETAIREAQRFIDTALKVEQGDEEDEKDGIHYRWVKGYTKNSSACKRASMDLTRSLAELRKP